MTFAIVAHHVVRGIRKYGTRGYGQDLLSRRSIRVSRLSNAHFLRGTALSSVA